MKIPGNRRRPRRALGLPRLDGRWHVQGVRAPADVDLKRVVFKGVPFDRCTIPELRLHDATVEDCVFTNCNVEQLHLWRTTFQHIRLSAARSLGCSMRCSSMRTSSDTSIFRETKRFPLSFSISTSARTELTYRELQHHALRNLNDLIPFDAGLMGMGTIQNGVPHGHDILLDRCPPELMESWQEVKHEDRVALWAFQHPGETGNFATDGPIFDGCDAARAHCKRWRIEHVMCTSQISAKVGLYWVLSMYRADASRPFSELERETMQLVFPHVVVAARRARIGHLRMRTRVTDGHGQAAAIANAEGLVLEAEPGFAELLATGWAGWGGPTLPTDVVAALASGKPARIAKKKLVLRTDAADGVILVHVRRAVPADALTSREREIAEAFSLGETHRELDERLGLAPNTVRRHLSNIYQKLGISSKVELERMLSHAR